MFDSYFIRWRSQNQKEKEISLNLGDKYYRGLP